jgi:hypothetical protein
MGVARSIERAQVAHVNYLEDHLCHGLSIKPGLQSTERYAQGSRLLTDRCASHERDGDAEQHAGLPRFRPPCGCNTLRTALPCYCCLE